MAVQQAKFGGGTGSCAYNLTSASSTPGYGSTSLPESEDSVSTTFSAKMYLIIFCFLSFLVFYFLVFSSLVLSCLFFSFLFLSLLCFALLCFALLCFALLCFALLCFALLCFALLCFALLCFALLCFALLCFALLCFALLCFALLCFALLCFALLCFFFLLFCFVLFCFVLFCFVLFCFFVLEREMCYRLRRWGEGQSVTPSVVLDYLEIIFKATGGTGTGITLDLRRTHQHHELISWGLQSSGARSKQLLLQRHCLSHRSWRYRRWFSWRLLANIYFILSQIFSWLVR